MKDRLFIAVRPAGIGYADRHREQHNDYMTVAFLPYSTLKLEWHEQNPPAELRKAIEADAANMAARRGEHFRTSACGQTVLLG